MRVLDRIYLQIALAFARRRPMPNRYSLDVDGARSQHFLGVAIEDETKTRLRFLVQDRCPGRLSRFSGRYYEDGMNESVDACISLSWFSCPKLRVTRVYGPIEIEYTSLFDFLFHTLTLTHLLTFRRQLRDQRHFNTNFRFTAELADTLEKLVQWQEVQAKEQSPLDWNWKFHHLDALNALYPPQIWGHGENNFFIVRFKLALDALVENGDLKKVEQELSTYVISPKALQTLSENEKDNSRHRDSEKQSIRLVWLTGIIAFATFFQIFV